MHRHGVVDAAEDRFCFEGIDEGVPVRNPDGEEVIDMVCVVGFGWEEQPGVAVERCVITVGICPSGVIPPVQIQIGRASCRERV